MALNLAGGTLRPAELYMVPEFVQILTQTDIYGTVTLILMRYENLQDRNAIQFDSEKPMTMRNARGLAMCYKRSASLPWKKKERAALFAGELLCGKRLDETALFQSHVAASATAGKNRRDTAASFRRSESGRRARRHGSSSASTPRAAKLRAAFTSRWQ